MANFDLNQFGNAEELAREAARQWLENLRQRGTEAAPFIVALAGGRIAGIFFSTVASLAQNSTKLLDCVHYFWGDERCVPADDPESNFALAWNNLLKPLAVPESRIHRIQGEKLPELAATEAETELYRLAPAGPDGQPLIDLLFLGMGEDGHVASLFPGEPGEVMTSGRVFRSVIGPKPPPRRITLGYRAIAAARDVWILVSGRGKEQVFRESLSPTGATPMARVLQSRQRTRIFTDLR